MKPVQSFYGDSFGAHASQGPVSDEPVHPDVKNYFDSFRSIGARPDQVFVGFTVLASRITPRPTVWQRVDSVIGETATFLGDIFRVIAESIKTVALLTQIVIGGIRIMASEEEYALTD